MHAVPHLLWLMAIQSLYLHRITCLIANKTDDNQGLTQVEVLCNIKDGMDSSGTWNNWVCDGTDKNVCNWQGVDCSFMNQIDSIDFGVLDGSGSGPLSAHIGHLTNLAYLHLGENTVSGSIPTEFGLLTNLLVLGMKNNMLTGTIPSELGLLSPYFFAMELNNNKLTGTLPTELGTLINLHSLNLSNNDFEGEVPESYCNLVSMVHFQILGDTKIKCLPECILQAPHSSLRNLVHAEFDRNLPPCGLKLSSSSSMISTARVRTTPRISSSKSDLSVGVIVAVAGCIFLVAAAIFGKRCLHGYHSEDHAV